MANDNVQDEFKVLKDDVAKLRKDVSDLAGLLKDLGLQKVDETRESVEDELQAQREKLRQALGEARNRSRSALDDVELQVTERPLGALLTAFGVGFVIAKLSGGRS